MSQSHSNNINGRIHGGDDISRSYTIPSLPEKLKNKRISYRLPLTDKNSTFTTLVLIRKDNEALVFSSTAFLGDSFFRILTFLERNISLHIQINLGIICQTLETAYISFTDDSDVPQILKSAFRILNENRYMNANTLLISDYRIPKYKPKLLEQMSVNRKKGTLLGFTD